MKNRKSLFVVASLVLLATSCGSTPSVNNNPFNPATEISREQAAALISLWKHDVDTSATYVAHYRYEVNKHKDTDKNGFYIADYLGPNEIDIEFHTFEYVEDSISPDSTIPVDDSEFKTSVVLDYEFYIFEKYIENKEDMFHFYLTGEEEMSFFAEISGLEVNGYSYQTMNKNGLLLYSKQYEQKGDQYLLQTEAVTYSEVH